MINILAALTFVFMNGTFALEQKKISSQASDTVNSKTSLNGVDAMKKIFTPEIDAKIQRFYDSSAPEQEDLLREILQIANRNEIQFKTAVRADMDRGAESAFPVVVESLSSDLNKWGPFLAELLDAVYDRYQTSKSPVTNATDLGEFSFVRKGSGTYIDHMIARCLKELNSPHLEVRIGTILTLGSFMRENKSADQIASALEKHLNADEYRERHHAYLELKDADRLPSGYSRSLMDWLRTKFSK